MRVNIFFKDLELLSFYGTHGYTPAHMKSYVKMCGMGIEKHIDFCFEKIPGHNKLFSNY